MVIINITDPKRKIEFGEPCFNDEYLLFSFEVEAVNHSILHKEFNTYINGDKI